MNDGQGNDEKVHLFRNICTRLTGKELALYCARQGLKLTSYILFRKGSNSISRNKFSNLAEIQQGYK